MKDVCNGQGPESDCDFEGALEPRALTDSELTVACDQDGFPAVSECVPVARLAEHIGQAVSGLYRFSAFSPRQDRFGRPYSVVKRSDQTGSVRVYGWPRNGVPSGDIQLWYRVHARVLVRRFNGAVTGDLLELTQAGGSMEETAPNGSSGRLPADLAERLDSYIAGCPVEPLQMFLREVFTDAEFGRAFLTRPASRAHHHAWSGGLAEHSLEVAITVGAILACEAPSIGVLASAAGLVHDLGKVRTLDDEGVKTGLGWVVHHDALTLEILAPALSHLDVLWPDSAATLRYLLTWNRSQVYHRPLLPAALALEFADRYSSAVSAEAQTFHGAPGWQRFAALAVPDPHDRFWRPSAYLKDAVA